MKVKEDSQIGVRRLSGGRGQLGGGWQLVGRSE